LNLFGGDVRSRSFDLEDLRRAGPGAFVPEWRMCEEPHLVVGGRKAQTIPQ